MAQGLWTGLAQAYLPLDCRRRCSFNLNRHYEFRGSASATSHITAVEHRVRTACINVSQVRRGVAVATKCAVFYMAMWLGERVTLLRRYRPAGGHFAARHVTQDEERRENLEAREHIQAGRGLAGYIPQPPHHTRTEPT